MEPRRDGPGKPFDIYYTQTPTHTWVHDLQTGSLEELCTKDRIAPFETPALLISDQRILMQVVKDRVGRIVSMNLDGTDSRDFTKPGDGLPYGLSLSHDGKRVAYHLASPQGYQIWTSDLDGENRQLIKAAPGHLFFGTSWSPDDQWILYVDCIPASDPGHDWAEVCVGKADGTEHRQLTEGMAMWFAATYGPPEARGSGSNLPAWTPAGKILFPIASPTPKSLGSTASANPISITSIVITNPNPHPAASASPLSILLPEESPTSSLLRNQSGTSGSLLPLMEN
ncbi:MAG: hypothetical protein KDA36_03565 [Planctomycetaceae bacterium]|nr:hypothetical protein [Planctomycetaceae bacterium]